MKSAACVIVALMLTTGCAFNLGPIQIAVGDSYVEQCDNGSTFQQLEDGSTTLAGCTGEYDMAQGGKISEPATALWRAVFDAVGKLVGFLIPSGLAGGNAGVAE